jgi:predicted dehydrogenase
MIRAGIVGLGWWGKTLVNSVHGKSSQIQFVAAQTRSPEKAEDFCRSHGIALHQDLDSLLSDPGIDAIVSTTPHSEHEDQVLRAATAGKNIYIEKPFTLNRRSAERAIEAASNAGIVLAVGFQRRFNLSHRDLKARVQNNSLGTIVHCAAEATASGSLFVAADTWRNDPDEMLAGSMTPLGIHALDGMIDLLGAIDTVYCLNLKRAGGRVEDTTSTLFELRSGASASLVSSMATARNYRMTVYGTHGSAEAAKTTKETLKFVPVVDPTAAAKPVPQTEFIEFPASDVERAALEAFAVAIGHGTTYPVPAAELLHVVASFEAIVQSAATRAPVRVNG